MQRSKTTEQGAVLTELNTEPGVIQFEYQSQIIEKFTGKIKQTSAGWMVLVETPKKPLVEKLTQIIHFLTPGKPHMTLQQAITVLNEDMEKQRKLRKKEKHIWRNSRARKLQWIWKWTNYSGQKNRINHPRITMSQREWPAARTPSPATGPLPRDAPEKSKFAPEQAFTKYDFGPKSG